MTGRVLVVGATSGIGRCAVEEAVSRDLPVRAFARSADRLGATSNIDPFAGDARNAGDISRALDGVTAVIQALGIRERLAMLWQEETLFSESTRILVPAMKDAGVQRLVSVTGFGAGRSRHAMSAVERMGHHALLGKPYADKDRQEALIMESALDWTIVRPVILTNGRASGQVQVLDQPSRWRNGLVSRREVARVLIDMIAHGNHLRSDVVVTR